MLLNIYHLIIEQINNKIFYFLDDETELEDLVDQLATDKSIGQKGEKINLLLIFN